MVVGRHAGHGSGRATEKLGRAVKGQMKEGGEEAAANQERTGQAPCMTLSLHRSCEVSGTGVEMLNHCIVHLKPG